MSTRTPHLARRRLAVIAATAAAAALLAGASPAAAQAAGARAASSGTWGTAEEVPGTAALNQGGGAAVQSVSCASAGNCSAAGDYSDSGGGSQAFVVSQVNGTWGNAIEVPGTASLNQGGFADFDSVSCASAGNCSAGGSYADSSGGFQAFVVSQKGGTWGTAKEVAAALNTGGIAQVNSVSCASAGNCSAGGYYGGSAETPFVVSQVHGTWGTPVTIPGSVSGGIFGMVLSVSCASAGNCSAGGAYTTSSGRAAFVVSQVGGAWGTPVVVNGTSTRATVTSVSCAAAGSCSAGGSFTDSSGHQQAFVVNQIHGTWGTAKEVPGTATLNQGGSAQIGGVCFGEGDCGTVSCASAGNCTASGTYTDSSGHQQAFVVTRAGGRWGTAKEVPGTATLNTGGKASISSLSCASAGNCSAGGFYKDSSGHQQAFVVSQVNGIWGTAKKVPGTATLNTGGNASIQSVSCPSAGNCGAGGAYTDSSGNLQAFVVSQT
jgi:D-alanine-D-alanine ligase-like ATP-grasp enzyme